MLMGLRLAGGLAALLAVLTLLDAVGLWVMFSGPAPDKAETAPARSGEFLWMAIFLLVMATSLLAAARRGASALRRALRPR